MSPATRCVVIYPIQPQLVLMVSSTTSVSCNSILDLASSYQTSPHSKVFSIMTLYHLTEKQVRFVKILLYVADIALRPSRLPFTTKSQFFFTGKFRALKSSNRPVKKHLLVSEDRIRRNFNFPNLLDEDIIISPIRWFEHISSESLASGNCEDINTSTISSRNSRTSNPSNSGMFNLNEIIIDHLANTEDVHPCL